jgi:hypothetical protein
MAKPLSKPPAHALTAYRRDFDAIAAMIVGDGEPLADMALVTSPMESLRWRSLCIRPSMVTSE